ncbi:MAG: hypothetical protein QM764_24425 [Chitinophagaceae bacterium]
MNVNKTLENFDAELKKNNKSGLRHGLYLSIIGAILICLSYCSFIYLGYQQRMTIKLLSDSLRLYRAETSKIKHDTLYLTRHDTIAFNIDGTIVDSFLFMTDSLKKMTETQVGWSSSTIYQYLEGKPIDKTYFKALSLGLYYFGKDTTRISNLKLKIDTIIKKEFPNLKTAHNKSISASGAGH